MLPSAARWRSPVGRPARAQAEKACDLALVHHAERDAIAVPREVPADGGGMAPSVASERCRITGVPIAPAASITIFASIVP